MSLIALGEQVLNGLVLSVFYALAALGLAIIFGVLKIVNFAHGSLYMLGAYIAATLVPRLLDLWFGPVSFWLGIVASALAVGAIGVVLEIALLRRIYRSPELFQLLATFGVVLVVQDAVVQIFGPQDILGPRAPGLRAFGVQYHPEAGPGPHDAAYLFEDFAALVDESRGT